MAISRQEFDLIPLTTRDYARAAELVRKYSDRRHFYAVREPRGFTLHPAV